MRVCVCVCVCGCGVGVHVYISSDTCIHVQYSALYKEGGRKEGRKEGREDTGTQDILVTIMLGAVVGNIGG